jgi:hypothetical protein
MTKTFAALVLVVVAASPAMAATYHHRAASQAYAADEAGTAYMPANSNVVIENGVFAGADPDANVRLSLREQANQNWSN